ncbi:MAG: S1 RNA-binding domain-containing protein [Dehalococcoidia bacterium]|nr:S1 RNA-binding domain-containing protein [Dehalococcoidia bacterium]
MVAHVFNTPDETGMWKLLEQSEDTRPPRPGEAREGTIVRISPDSLLVNIGLKADGIIPPTEMRSLTPEMLSAMKLGEAITVTVVDSENKEGQVVLSWDRARIERDWDDIKSVSETGQTVKCKVTGYNRGGLVAYVGNIQGFIPLSQLSSAPKADAPDDTGAYLAPMIGKILTTKVLEINRLRNRVVLSERQASQENRAQQKDRLLKELEVGKTVKGKVSGISSFGVFVNLGGANGLIHISELAWEQVKNPEDMVKVGDEIEVYVLKIDVDTKKIALSLKRTQQEPWALAEGKYKEGQLVNATITRLTNFGAFAKLDSGMEGLIHISELSEKRVTNPNEVVKEGDAVTLKLLKVEPDKRRMALSLRQAAEEQAVASYRASLQTDDKQKSLETGVTNNG